MICPACGYELTAIHYEGIDLDVCDGGCGGMWFDNYELDRIVQGREGTAEPLRVQYNPRRPVDTQDKRRCPRCEAVIMHRHLHRSSREIEVDKCPKCGGVWLDRGELAGIREQAASNTSAKAAGRNDAAQGKSGAPETVLPYFSRHIHYNPLGLTGYRSGVDGLSTPGDWADVIEGAPSSRSAGLRWGLGVILALFFVLLGLRVCLTRALILPVRQPYEALHISGWGAVAGGMQTMCIGLFLHFHFWWATSDNLMDYARTAK
ncbi:MAG: hypothetical protein EOM20_21815, partial [Spartobacteria bacterium]|nr:hypothetical protein [Spartobacteria bacterium]